MGVITQGAPFVIVLASLLCAEGADKNKPHYHKGILPKFKAGPPSGIGFKLTSAQNSALARGENVLATIANKGGDGSCVAVLDIPVSKHIIWERITDYKRARRTRAAPRPRRAPERASHCVRVNWSRFTLR
jgi:hypothetical protein